MTPPPDQVEELKAICREVSAGEEGGLLYLLLRDLVLPADCTPANLDALLCTQARDGYPTRLFFASMVSTPRATPNWNASSVRILERLWFAYSWKGVPANLRYTQMIAAHLRGLS